MSLRANPRSPPENPMEILLPDGWPRPSGYSNGIRVPAGRDLVFIAGMVGWDESERIVSTDFVDQFEQAVRNVRAVLERGGGTPDDLVRVTVYVADAAQYTRRRAEVGQAWRRVLGLTFPTMSLVEVSRLLEDGALVEVEATAAVAASGSGSAAPGT